MKKSMKSGSLLLVIVLVVGILSACGAVEFDASRFVEGNLDCYMKGDVDIMLEMTEATEEEALAEYEFYFSYYAAEYEGTGVSEDTMQAIIDAYKEIYTGTKYEVGEAELDSDGDYIVEVVITPLIAFDGYSEEYNERALLMEDALLTEMDAGVEFTDAEIYEQYALIDVEMLEERAENYTYGEEVTVEVLVYYEDGYYYVDDEDFVDLDFALVLAEN